MSSINITQAVVRAPNKMSSEKGTMGHEALQNISFESLEDKEIILMLLKKYDEYLNTFKTDTRKRYEFFSRMKKENESIEDFIADLRERAKSCNFESPAKSFVREKVILEIIRQILLDTEDSDLKKIITTYKFYEATRGQMNQICLGKAIQMKNAIIAPSKTSAQTQWNNVHSKCGTRHAFNNCPAFYSECRKCHGRGHYARMCNAYLARISYKRNRPGSNTDGPFSQINKNSKVGSNTRNCIMSSTTSNTKRKYSSGGQFRRRIPPPKYTRYPVPTTVYNSEYMGPSCDKEKPVCNSQSNVTKTSNNIYATPQSTTRTTRASMQNASTLCSDTKSRPSLISDNATVTKNAQLKGSLDGNLRRTTSSSNVMNSPVRNSKEADDDFAVKCCSCFIC